jgi:flavin reductase (DIM6/NTAB) family NADH-FMN oxidoreductase RutF
VHEGISAKAHYTSAKFEKNESEFDQCGLSEEYLNGFAAPFVLESRIKLAVRHVNTYEISESQTLLVIGAIESIYLPEKILKADGQLDLTKVGTLAVSGLNTYHQVNQLASYAYARPGIFPANLIHNSDPQLKPSNT